MIPDRGLSEDDLRRLEPLISDLRHEVGNPLNVLKGRLELARESGVGELEEASEQQLRELDDYLEKTEYAIGHLELMGTLPEEEVSEIQDYAEEAGLPGGFDRQVDRISSVMGDVRSYQQKLITGETGEEVTVSELLKPLESCADGMDVETDFEYGGLEEERPYVDRGMKLLFWTLGKNWENHAYGEVEDLELGFDVNEAEDVYEVDVWDTGPGLFEQHPGEDGKAVESRYRRAYSLFNSGDEGGHGLKMASNIADIYDADIFYNEEMIEEEGFGVTVELPKY